jgi:hypothetical protein
VTGAALLRYSSRGTISTGDGLWFTIAEATLPKMIRDKPVRARDEITAIDGLRSPRTVGRRQRG